MNGLFTQFSMTTHSSHLKATSTLLGLIRNRCGTRDDELIAREGLKQTNNDPDAAIQLIRDAFK